STPDLDSLERQACPGAGACGGQFTANTMATVCETLGISPFGSASVPATDEDKSVVARAAGVLVMDVLKRGVRPRQILTRVALLADLKPGGRFVATDLHHAGGIPLVVRRLLEGGHLHADAMTISGRT